MLPETELKPKILSVDDDPVNNEIIEDILGDKYDVRSVLSGKEALELLVSYSPDMILLDVMMPEINGYELCQRIRANPKTKHIKILHISAFAQLEGRLKCYDLGTNDFISRPFNHKELLAKIDIHMGLKNKNEINNLKLQILRLLTRETRTPLNGIMSSAQLLDMSDSMSEEDRGILSMINESSERLAELVDKCQLLSDITEAPNLPHIEPLNLAAMADEILDGKKLQVDEGKLQVRLEGRGSPISVEGNREMVKIVLESVLDNAIKFAHENTEISVEFYEEDGYLVGKIGNRGPVVPRHRLTSVFEAFHSGEIDTRVDGHGLSLPIAKSIMHKHGGQIAMESDEERGTNVYLLFPLQLL